VTLTKVLPYFAHCLQEGLQGLGRQITISWNFPGIFYNTL